MLGDISSIDAGALVTGMGGGLALFLFGMRVMTQALKVVAGASMKNLLARLTANRFSSALAGALITSIVQSSSVTTVLVVGFVTSGIMNLTQAIGVIIGANIGTTITGQIIAFNIAKYGLLMISVGFFVELLSKHERYRQIGKMLLGLGLVFFGMELMTGATLPLRTWEPFIHFIQKLERPLPGIAVGLLFTALIQSSSATTGIVIVLASQGMVLPVAAISILLGANLGTCMTALLSAVGSPRESMQVAVVHVLFNMIGVAIWFFFIPQLTRLVQVISPADVGRQIANAHTLFNLSAAALLIWFTTPLAWIARRLVPLRPAEEVRGTVQYLDDFYLDQPAIALDRVRMELFRQSLIVHQMLIRLLDAIIGGSPQELDQLRRDNADVDELQGAIVTWLGRLSQQNLLDPIPQRILNLIAISNYLENMGDVIESNLVEAARKAERRGAKVSPGTFEVIRPLHERVVEASRLTLEALQNRDLKAAQEAAGSKPSVNRLAYRATSHLLSRLVANEPNRLAVFRFETDIIENLKRLNTLTRRIARIILEIEGSSDAATEDSPKLNEPQSSND
jgi:phosphate:Na+ symporter